MPILLHQLISSQIPQHTEKCALLHKDQQFSYSELFEQVSRTACGFISAGLALSERVAIYLPKLPETV
ncbi:MAG: AMP-binding protein, partial [Gammaproteobacteria bacterium]|nr:AMP-binding protein [Gammaproteobacteria bacterium]